MYKLTQTEFVLYVLLAGIGVGFLLGLIPLITGIVKKKVKLGILGLVASTIGGVLGLILAVPIVVIFMWLILKKPTATGTDQHPLDAAFDKDVR